jgi:hypothetical protein
LRRSQKSTLRRARCRDRFEAGQRSSGQILSRDDLPHHGVELLFQYGISRNGIVPNFLISAGGRTIQILNLRL